MPESIGHYKVLDHLGAGGLGEVYRARDTRTGRTVAVRVLPSDLVAHPVGLPLLLETTKALTNFSHPSIASLFEVGRDDHCRFLVFEFVPGELLSTVIDGTPLNVRRAVEFAIQLADALGEAEGVHVVHGDIRPGNIMVTSKDRAKLMNFGLRAFTNGGDVRDTIAAPYMAPEESAAGIGDARSDIFSLGAVLFEMLTGKPRGKGLPPSSMNSAVPPELDRIVGRMIASNVQNRYQSAVTVAAELRSMAAILEQRATAEEAAFRPRRQTERWPAWVTVAVVGVLVLFAATVVWLWAGAPQ